MAEIRGGDVGSMVRTAWDAHHGVMCIGVNWERHCTTLPPQTLILSPANLKSSPRMELRWRCKFAQRQFALVICAPQVRVACLQG